MQIINPRKIALQQLKANGYRLDREGANHEVYVNPTLKARTTVSRSSHFDDDDLQMILAEIKRYNRLGQQ